MSDYGFFNNNPVAEHDDSAEREVERLQAELAAVRAERDALAIMRERAEAVYAIRGRIFADPILVHREILAMGRALKHVNEGQGGAG